MFQTSLTARVTRDPELRYTTSGKAVINLSLAHNSRAKDPASGQWVDAEVTFLEATFWEDYAEHVAESLHQGDIVLVSGDLSVESYTASDGTKRTKVVLRADEIGPALRFQTASVKRSERSGLVRADAAVAEVAAQLGGRPLQAAPAY